MTLEDFFTLTEMKDGLTAPSRVEELISAMQREQDSVVKNAGDATRQWASVASTIAATENKDCLDLFIQLDGLRFINRWLNDAQNVGFSANDGTIEESITAMLRAVEKLYIDREKSISSGIWATVSNLLGHQSSKVQDRARVLYDNWKGGGNGDAESQHSDIGRMNVSDKVVREECHLSSVKEAGNDDDHASRVVGGEESLLRSSDSQLPEKIANVQIHNSDNAFQSSLSLDCEDTKEKSNQLAIVLVPTQEITPVGEAGMTSSETHNLPAPKQGSFKGQPDDLQLGDLSKKEMEDQNANCPPEKLRAPHISLALIQPDPGPVSIGASEASIKPESDLEHNIKSNEDGVCHKIIVSDSVGITASDRMSEVGDAKALNSSNPQPDKATENNDGCCSNTMQDLSISGIKLEKPEDLQMSFLETEDGREVKEEGKGHVSNNDNGTSNGSESFKQGKGPRSPKIIDKNSDIELDCGIVDALEVARQVAQEVERDVKAVKEDSHVSTQGDDTSNGSDSFKQGEGPKSPGVVDKNSDMELEYGIVDALEVARQVAEEVEREIQNSSSEKISEGGNRQAGSSDSVGKNDELARVLPEEVSSRQSNPAEACSEEEGHMSVLGDIEAEPEGPECLPDLESSQVTEAARDPGGNSEKSLCTFDLNEEVGSDDVGVSSNAMSTTPIPIVSASRTAQTSGLPTAPLKFDGTLQWKGSAATSAFRPASPHENTESEKNVSVGGNSDISKQRQDCLDIDLNVAEGEEEFVKQIGESPGLPSGQSSVELSPKRSRRFELDLNSVGDDGDTQPSDQRMEGQLLSGRNGYWSPSPASSSSSMQPSVRNIDLNDKPLFQTDLVDKARPTKSSSNVETYGLSKSDAPVISILGAKVEVGRKEFVPQIWSIPNGKAIIEPAMDLTMSGAGGVLGLTPTVPYNNHSTVFGYNQLTSASPLSLSSAKYGSGGTIPYMVDSRGAPIVPQVGAGVGPSSYTQPPFIMSMTGTQLGLNGVGPSRPNFDLNSGLLIDGGNRDALATRPFFFPAQGRAMEEQHVRTLPQSSSSSGVGGKRKEPDSSWETYPFSYKHQQPPWK
ncbi:uncharacterized protein LOC130718014 [Lotus japonicus]|uniref:uncharacterized protein LOC130718014 n=1 Tax=Lotus japonicus TaxID=34305 RepID=UPI002587A71A|nr:uncharacterized protein LOC130718014 [Lotus japonicus]